MIIFILFGDKSAILPLIVHKVAFHKGIEPQTNFVTDPLQFFVQRGERSGQSIHSS